MTITTIISQCSEDGDDSDYGRLAQNSDDEDDIEADAESWEKYASEGNSHIFYPISLGDILDQRYRVEHKLGHGGFSTVWMAHDLRLKKDVALKVMASGKAGEHEHQIQNRILDEVEDTSHLSMYQRTFFLHGNERDHRVLVLPLQGKCLTIYNVSEKPMAIRMSAARQLLQAVESLHRAGFVHRDLQDRNCIWGIKSLNGLSRSAKYEALGQPIKQRIPYLKLWKKGEIVVPVKVPDELCTDAIYLGDFGLAMKVGEPVSQEGIPPGPYCSPDRLHGNNPSFGCDMWSYMCIFSQLYLGFVPLPSVGVMVRILGPLPRQWKGRYAHPPSSKDEWYEQKDTKTDPETSLVKDIERRRPDIDPDERRQVASFMSKCFNYSAEKRPSATQLLNGPSFNAIIDKYCG